MPATLGERTQVGVLLQRPHDIRFIVYWIESLPTATFYYMVHTATSEDKYCCPKCKSCHVDFYDYKGKKYQSCLDCGYEEMIKN